MKSMNRKESKKIAVMAAVIMGLMMFAFMPLASAGITSFRVTPGTGLAGTVDSYDALVTTTGVTMINISIPKGFSAVAPTTGGVLIAEVDFWNSTRGMYYGSATITANDTDPTTKVDVDCEFQVGSDTLKVEAYSQEVSYTAGATNRFESGFAGDTSEIKITLPETQDGSINVTINCTHFNLDDMAIQIKQFVRNPSVADVYDFYADGEVAHVNIHHQPLGDIAYLKQGAGGTTDYGLYIYTAPTTIGQHGALTASDLWSPDGSTVAVK
jgi:hypothetical protein